MEVYGTEGVRVSRKGLRCGNRNRRDRCSVERGVLTAGSRESRSRRRPAGPEGFPGPGARKDTRRLTWWFTWDGPAGWVSREGLETVHVASDGPGPGGGGTSVGTTTPPESGERHEEKTTRDSL